MTSGTKKGILTRIAQVLSDVFSPIVMPTYMMAVAMWITPLVIIPEGVRFATMGVVAALTAIMPVAAIFTLIKLGKVGDVSISNPKERLLPYSISIACYLAAILFLRNIHVPMWLSNFYIGAAVAALLASVITLRWKISAHGSAVGGFAAGLYWMAVHHLLLFGPLLWVAGGVLLCGLVGSSRLILGRHTPAQVFAGFALGAISVYVSMLFI